MFSDHVNHDQVSGLQIGVVSSAKGSHAALSLRAEAHQGQDRPTVGRLVGIKVGDSNLVGSIMELSAETDAELRQHGFSARAAIDLVGEIIREEGATPMFRRGVTRYPAIGDAAHLIAGDDLRLIYKSSTKRTIEIGSLQADPSIAASVNVEDLVSRHFAILGTTGVGKSSAVALLLNEILYARPGLRIFMLDGHNEYGRCFGSRANVLGARNLRLPFWMFNFEEFTDILYAGRPATAEETEILAELIPRAKARYGQYRASEDRPTLKRDDPKNSGITVDTPVPYMIQDLVGLLDEAMGRLDNRSSRLHYHRLITRIETLRGDARYAFMFENANVGGDILGEIITQLFQLDPGGLPMTVMQLGGLPAEAVDAVVCVLARTAFEFGLWSEGAAPLLFMCEEAHRYASADHATGFNPTRRALSRIAKEGRKYGVFLGLVSQRPAELDPTIISQCSTLFVMRMANERDQALLRSAVPDAGANLLAFVPSLGTREAIVFGEGVTIPARVTFRELPAYQLPRTDITASMAATPETEGRDLVSLVVDRWRGIGLQKAAGEMPKRELSLPAAAPRPSAALDSVRNRLMRRPLAGDEVVPGAEAPVDIALRQH